MLHIWCPWCGEHREEEEFHPKGQAHIVRPADPDACSDEEWGEYLFFRDNPRGIHRELWVHAAGCRKFFNMVRNTVSYEILETYRIGEQPKTGAGADVVPLPRRDDSKTETVTPDERIQAGGGV
ncbi:sarcosine oxidase subunit delta [Serratia rhizosphaerae]|uniref:sarcosine oxidase subunit delta n=1 Tax=unclassified Serratia (in: enterobacteria) TaxID=2647522 RepID=UPI000CF69DF2|nr:MULTISPECIES: sarcosine oxidase subunit delta [unclassified Serratia (in: enterobacteria)]MBU3892105.1 sarcosine oxidase subunit delta [Serratia rubidaea]AVJ18547.1 sarcosine oxidase subunit delta [Serratia sp. MYb239]MCA4822702.1 sarcosine oxidase subunit delta [Serratia rubidaea]QNK33954.1 sarcosine oxidase subunit delta [Serratia sp. JUb9]QPT12100.1 sarcosine oxidase subunit delta [Serratia rubidaea]